MAGDITEALTTLAERLQGVLDALGDLDDEARKLEEDLAEACSAWDEDERDGAVVLEDVWARAAALHDEAHRSPHDPTAFVFCQRDSCRALKDVLSPGWREVRPGLVG